MDNGGTKIMVVLDIGCGNKKAKGAVGIDRIKTKDVDILCDLDIGLPFKENVFEKIICDSVLEHTANIVGLMEELHRVGRDGCLVEICVPHFTSRSAYMDPTHKTFFSYRTFDYFAYNPNFIDYYTQNEFEILERKICFKKIPYFWNSFFELFANIFPDFYESTFLKSFPASNLIVTLKKVM